MLIFMLVTAALTVSIVSRRVTTYYPNFSSLYDLAVAGNEQVLFYLSETPEEDRTIPTLTAIAAASYPREWEITVVLTPEGEPPVSDTYHAVTTVTPLTDRLRVQTRVYRAPGGTPATVRAYVVLDGLTLQMVHSRRIII
jgi:hypothetical protein